MLANIAEESKDDARRLLTLLCYSHRPLTVAEVIEGIAVELGDNPRLNTDGRLEGEEDIIQLCPGFIEIDRHTRVLEAFQGNLISMGLLKDYFNIYPDSFRSSVRIAHFSVQEYLESKRILDRPVSDFGVQLADAHAEIGSVCLTYLLGLPSARWRHEYPLAIYAAAYWVDHYRKADICKYGIQNQALQLLGPGSSKRGIWHQLVENANSENEATPVACVSGLGIHSLLLAILDSQPYRDLSPEQVAHVVNENEERFISALHLGVMSGNLEVVKTLVQRGAHVNTCAKDRSPLMRAISEDNGEITRFLIDQGADLDKVVEGDGYLESPLILAIKHNNKSAVDLLLDRGAKATFPVPFQLRSRVTSPVYWSRVTSSVYCLRTASYFAVLLETATKHSDRAMIEFLLAKRAESSARGTGTASSQMAMLDCKEAMKAEMQVEISQFCNLVSETAQLWHATLFLDKGFTFDMGYDSLSNYAVRLDDADFLQFLGRQGLGVTFDPLRDLPRLPNSIRRPKIQCLGQFLLERCANTSIPNAVLEDVGETAASYGFMGLAEELFQKCSNFDETLRWRCYEAALLLAAEGKRYEDVALLVESGTFGIAFNYGTVLLIVARNGNEATARLLIEKGADVNLYSWPYGNALIVATKYGHEEIVRLLIKAVPMSTSSVCTMAVHSSSQRSLGARR